MKRIITLAALLVCSLTLMAQSRIKPRPIVADDITRFIPYTASYSSNIYQSSLGDDYKKGFWLENWMQTNQVISWTTEVEQEGDYTVELIISPDGLTAGNSITYSLTSGDSQAEATTTDFGWQRLRSKEVIHLEAGTQKLELRIKSTPGGVYTRFWGMELAQPEVREAKYQKAMAMRADVSWMNDIQYAFFFHWNSRSMPRHGDKLSYNEAVKQFDVDRFAQMVDDCGAGLVVFTTSWAEYYFPAPMHTIDSILPGRTSERDLVSDLSDALARHNIRLMLYYHMGHDDGEWWEKQGFTYDDPGRLSENVEAVMREISQRFGDKLAGMWIDDGKNYYQNYASFERIDEAVKSANPNMAVGFNSWEYPRVTDFQDFYDGEAGLSTHSAGVGNPYLPAGGKGYFIGGPQDGLKATYCGCFEPGEWAHIYKDAAIDAPYYSLDQIEDIVRASWLRHNLPIINLRIYQDGTISDQSYQILRELKARCKRFPQQDLTVEKLKEANAFSAVEMPGRWGKPANWTVENFRIDKGGDGVRQGIDRWEGSNCLSFCIWDDKPADASPDARIYQTVTLAPGRYFFGAKFFSTINSRGYLYAATENVPTAEIATSPKVVGHYAIPYWGGIEDGAMHGFNFTLTEEQTLQLGVQTDAQNSDAQQQICIGEVALWRYDACTQETLTAKIAEVEEAVKTLPFDDNTGHYSRASLQPLTEALEAARAAKGTALDAAYEALVAAYDTFLTEGRNPGGEPVMDGATDLTERFLGEANGFSRTEETADTRWGHPALWTVENYAVPDGQNGIMQGLDNYPGSEHLYLGVWNNRNNMLYGDLNNARIYQRVSLKAGRYYFGAQYETNHWFYKNYLFAANDVVATNDVEAEALAFDNASVAADGRFHGIYFTLPTDQDVYLGWQANLECGSHQQEFRASDVKLLGYDWVEEEDGVEQIVNSQLSNGQVYDLQGRRIATPQRGIYILNGKKYVR